MESDEPDENTTTRPRSRHAERPLDPPRWWFEGPYAQREGFTARARALFESRQMEALSGIQYQNAAKHGTI
jgi:hypothetical protein